MQKLKAVSIRLDPPPPPRLLFCKARSRRPCECRPIGRRLVVQVCTAPRGRLYCCVTSYRLNRPEGKLSLAFQSFRLVAPDTALGSFLQGPRATGSDRNKSMSLCERSTGEPIPGSPDDLPRHAVWRESLLGRDQGSWWVFPLASDRASLERGPTVPGSRTGVSPTGHQCRHP